MLRVADEVSFVVSEEEVEREVRDAGVPLAGAHVRRDRRIERRVKLEFLPTP